MMQDESARKFAELDQLLNDPDVPMDPARVWSLLADLSERDAGSPTHRDSHRGAGSDATADGGSAD
ncbi:MAG TPA: peptide chain release factor 1 [Acetobacteraceae bacterium]|nr:peptide chain release factor 1 [Acetobacteraceae bacterium]